MSSKLRVAAFTLPVCVLLALAWWALRGGFERDDATAEAGSGESAVASLDAVADKAVAAAPDQAARVALTATAGDAARVALCGRVVDEAGQPIAGAKVSTMQWVEFNRSNDGAEDQDLEWSAQMQRFLRTMTERRVEVTTATDGRFTLVPRSEGGSLQLRVHARGYLVLEREAPTPSAELDLGDFTVRPAAVLSGRVLDRAGKPVAGAKVVRRGSGDRDERDDWQNEMFEAAWSIGAYAISAADGTYELAHVEAGTLSLQARHAEHATGRTAGLTAVAGGVLRDIDIVLEPGDGVRGRIVGMPSNARDLRVFARRAPLAGNEPRGPGKGGAQASPGAPERSVELGPGAAFALRGLPVGKPHLIWLAQTGPRAAGAVCSEVLEVLPGAQSVDLHFQPGAGVTFTVVAADDGKSVERLWVGTAFTRDRGGSVSGGPSRLRRYPEGRVELVNLRAGDKQTMTLTVAAVGFATHERKGIELPRTGALDLGVVKLDRVPAVRVQVLAAGARVARAQAALRVVEPKDQNREVTWGEEWGGGSARSARTDAEGRCTLSGPRQGKVTVAVTSAEFAPCTSEPITLVDGGADLTLTLVRGGAVDVSVVDADGKPLPNTSVAHRGPDDRVDAAATFAHGGVRFERLAPGEHRFRLGGEFDGSSGPGPGGNDAAWSKVAVADGQVAKLELRREPMATVIATIHEGGRPLSAAAVTFVRGPGGGQAGGFFGRRGQTDAAGRVTLKDVPFGDHRLRIAHASRAMSATVPIVLRAGPNVIEVDLPTTILRGVVRDAAGAPVAGVIVTVAPVPAAGAPAEGGFVDASWFGNFEGMNEGRFRTRTDAEGKYELRGVEAARALVVSGTAKGFAPGRSKPVMAALGTAVEGVDLALATGGSVAVVFDPAPQAAWLRLSYLDGQGEPGAGQSVDGPRTVFDSLRPGRWRVTLRSGNNEQRDNREVVVVAGQVTELKF